MNRMIVVFGILVTLVSGCWKEPIVVHRPVVFANDVTAEEVEVDHLEANSANIGGVIIEDGNITVPGTVTAEEVVTENDVTAGGTVTGQDVVDLIDSPVQPPPPVPPPPPASVCGNWVIEVGEQCDRLNFGSHTCFGYDGFVGGVLVCDANCKIVFSQCTRPPPPPIPPTALTVTLL